MGLLEFILGLFGWGKPRQAPHQAPRQTPSQNTGQPFQSSAAQHGHPRSSADSGAYDSRSPENRNNNPSPETRPVRGVTAVTVKRIRGRRRSSYVKLARLRRVPREAIRTPISELTVQQPPYPFARMGVLGGYFDLSQDGDSDRLTRLGLPLFQNPSELAAWLGLPVGRVAWLVHRCEEGQRPRDVRSAHYHFRWAKKRTGSYRLIEAPKPMLKAIQRRLLREILDQVPVHSMCQGFVIGRSIRTNAEPHTGQRVVVKLDLENFYSTVGHSRVVAIFRSLGYSREAAIWLAGLTTSSIPANMDVPDNNLSLLNVYRGRHLPQGAPTSPALANLSAFSLDLRLAGLSRKFQAQYTRYADDLTFSGPQRFLYGLPVFLPLVGKIIKAERFRLHPAKRQIRRSNQQQKVTGVVVNTHVNIDRAEYDRLKALLTNCRRHGAKSQNRDSHDDFAQHVLGRIGHVKHLNPHKGDKLLGMFRLIDWQS
jgi:RNA-directed DNA polymerase